MFCHRYTVDLEKKDDIWNLRPLGDIHIGSVGFDKEKFENEIKNTASLNAIVFSETEGEAVTVGAHTIIVSISK